MRHIYRCTQRRLQITYLNLQPIASRRFYPHRDDDMHLLMTSMRHGSWVPVITATDNCEKYPSPTTPRDDRSTHTCTITLRSQHGGDPDFTAPSYHHYTWPPEHFWNYTKAVLVLRKLISTTYGRYFVLTWCLVHVTFCRLMNTRRIDTYIYLDYRSLVYGMYP